MAMSKILIVDDDIKFVNIVSEELAAYGQFEVVIATVGGEEIDALEQGDIAMVIVDICAGNIEGLEFLSFMSVSYPRIPSIVLTRDEHPDIARIQNCAGRGFIFCYMAKPSSLQKIGSAIVSGLQRLDENDFASGITVVRLLLLLEAGRRTCRVRVKLGTKKEGFFDISNGILLDARCDEKEGHEAALELLDWPPVSFQMEVLPRENRQTITPDMHDALLTAVTPTASVNPAARKRFVATPDFAKIIKLLIVDDSRMMRKGIADLFSVDDTIEVVGMAADGKEALTMLPRLKPDVVTLDVQMPVMDGLTTLKHMMIHSPTPTIMLSAYTREGAVVTYDALKYGAVDFVAKPSSMDGVDLKEQAREIAGKIHLAAAVEMDAVKYIRTIKKDKDAGIIGRDHYETIVTLGAGEGGYGTLLKIIPHLSPERPAAYFVMLYAAPKNVDSYVDYLDTHSSVTVVRARHNAPVKGGVCYIASGEEYLTIHRQGSELVQHVSAAPFAKIRGSVNMLMFSAAETMQTAAAGIILSGLGEDGQEGLEEILRVGGSAVVQDPASCLYKDMVLAAQERSPAALVMTDTDIAGWINSGRLAPAIEHG